ncbi:hypothetical protein Poli38472_014643 [Pythium oligandrum]|uniref:Calcineurin-like phosphoesterase domain-containing protein n=1 Tax=Pythium oligandrum TaxID=41045 RepID=A0A8K1CKA5_PYTOL|nr:hypothetical protein Poli38472_014643 [Pythium oligandrum]|eukprot:TMW63938.1 hypothetical protein Poli38472_014643 [Pythium oligandrum]
MRVVCISDTHGLHDELHAHAPIPDGDVLIHAGDFTDTGDREEVLAFNAFLAKLPHKYKLVIAGNHESTFDRAFYPHNWQQYGHKQQYDPNEVRALLTNALYLEDEAVDLEGFLFYGSPWQPEFCNWAFNLPRGQALVDKWQLIPDDVDVLITHSPPLGRGDQVGHLRVGCEDLLTHVQQRIRPRFHVFGHVHEGYGSSSDGITTFLNASSCTHKYDAVNPAMVFELTAPPRYHGTLDPVASRKRSYDVLLHEQLRQCSLKPVFVPVQGPDAAPHPPDYHPHGPDHGGSLQAFRVEGTTAGQLFKSTLKLRPVVGEQTRALRYLFHHGFKGNDVARTSTDVVESVGKDQENEKMDRKATRRASLTRRVTVAVLAEREDPPEQTEEATPAPTKRRVRPNKSLNRREAVSRLATMMEEPSEEEEKKEEETPPPPPPPVPVPVVECVLCKYKVPGHIHPGLVTVAPVATHENKNAAAEEETKDQATRQDTDEQETPGGDTRSTANSRRVGATPQRLSSWF